MARIEDLGELQFHPVSRESWSRLKRLFGPRGASGGCWCMWWRLRHSEYERQKGDRNRRALKRLIDRGEIPGILAFHQDEPIAWCSIAPRGAFPRLQRSRILKPVDDEDVRSIVCLFIARRYRRMGVSVEVIHAATAYAAATGGRIVEAYPVQPRSDPMPDVFAATGIVAAFERAGFREVARRSPTRPIMRWLAPDEELIE